MSAKPAAQTATNNLPGLHLAGDAVSLPGWEDKAPEAPVRPKLKGLLQPIGGIILNGRAKSAWPSTMPI